MTKIPSMTAAVSLLAAAIPAFAQETEPVTLGDKEVGVLRTFGSDDPKRAFCQKSDKQLHLRKNEDGSLVILMCFDDSETTIKPESSCEFTLHLKSLFEKIEHHPNTNPQRYKLGMDDITAVEKQLCGKKEDKQEDKKGEFFRFQPYAAGIPAQAALPLRLP